MAARKRPGPAVAGHKLPGPTVVRRLPVDRIGHFAGAGRTVDLQAAVRTVPAAADPGAGHIDPGVGHIDLEVDRIGPEAVRKLKGRVS